jgi:hypothetical protein
MDVHFIRLKYIRKMANIKCCWPGSAISNITGVSGCKRLKGKEKMQFYIFEEKERR